MFDVLLVNPRTERKGNEQFAREPPIGLLILAACLKQHEYIVDIFDCSIFPDPEQELKRMASNYRVIGFTCLTNDFQYTMDLAKAIKTSSPEVLLLLGGPHVSFMAHTILERFPWVDFVFKGEAEKSLPLLLEYLLEIPTSYGKGDPLQHLSNQYFLDQLPRGIYCKILKESTQLYPFGLIPSASVSLFRINTAEWPLPPDLNTLPKPARALLSFPYAVADVLVNRGCPNQCSFCSRQHLFQNQPRLRPLQALKEELDEIRFYSNYRFVNFYDNINMNRKFFHGFLLLLIQTNFPLTWGCELRADALTLEEAHLMKKAGCVVAAAGAESASQEVLQANFKNQNPANLRRGFEFLKQAGINIQVYFVLGLPGETWETFQETLDYLETLPLSKGDHVNFFLATPYPGSRLWEEQGRFQVSIKHTDFTQYDCHHYLLEIPSLSEDEILKMKEIADETVRKLIQK